MKEATFNIPLEFINDWRTQPPVVAEHMFASSVQESNRRVDYYTYLITKDGLISPLTGQFIREATKRDSHVRWLEGQALDFLDNQVTPQSPQNEVIVSLYPPAPEVYPTSKITVSQKSPEGVLDNRAIVIDLNEADCLELAQNLGNLSVNRPLLESIDQVRANPLVLRTGGLLWSYILEEFLPNLDLSGIRAGEDIKAQNEVLERAKEIVPALLKGEEEALDKANEQMGSFEISCPAGISASSSKFEYKPGIGCMKCGRYGLLLGGCNICESCEKKYY